MIIGPEVKGGRIISIWAGRSELRHTSYTTAVVVLIIFTSLICLSPVKVMAGAVSENKVISLQEKINQSSPGETIELAPGTYQGPIIIDKRISIRGDRSVTLLNNTNKSAISILSDGVTLQGINISHNGNGESAGVQVNSNNVLIKDLSIHTKGYGIILRDSNKAVIQNNDITWFEPDSSHPERKGNGIDLYNSHDNQMIYNKISYLRDAIYLEKGRNETVKGNQISHSRYGIHCMYIDDSNVIDNVGEYNYTGAMVMVVTNTVVSNNSFRMQNENVYSQGILLYDVQTSSIENNVIEGNRIGIYMENSVDNQLKKNVLLRNFIGIQLIQAKGNTFIHNGFVANVIEATAKGSNENLMNENYWDSFKGIDLQHNGTSDIPYAINPFYQNVITSNSAYQLFFQSPGMTFLSELFTNGREHWSTDRSPLMKMDLQAVDHQHVGGNKTVLATGVMLLLAAIFTIIYFGGVRK